MRAENRIHYWDTLRAVLIFLVVLGHLLTSISLDARPDLRALGLWIYLFHMPAFFMISGFFSKSYLKRGSGGRIRLLTGYLILYVLFVAALHMGAILRFEGLSADLFLYCDNAPWFLLAMVFCHLILPLAARVGVKLSLILSLCLSMAWSLLPLPDRLLSLHRCVSFLPFFLLGFFAGSLELKLPVSRRARSAGAAGLLLAWAAVRVWLKGLQQVSPVIYATNGFRFYSRFLPHEALLLKSGWYAASLLLSVCLMALIPQGETPITYVGRYSLPVYIFHRIALSVLQELGLLRFPAGPEILVLAELVLLSLVLTLLPANPAAEKLCRLPFRPGPGREKKE